MMKRTRISTGILALGLTSSLALVGCTTGAADAQDDAQDESKGTITVGYLPSWTDAVNNAFLLQDQLEKIGYTVEMQTLTEPGMLYTALAEGDVDIYPSAWSDISQVTYMERYGDDLEDLGTYYDSAKGTLAVPSYVDIDTIDELKAQADRFDNTVYTIEPGSGTATMAKDNLFPAYGLDEDFTLKSSSLAAMLTVLQDAVESEEDVVVTLWRPFWGNDTFDLKALEDPKDGMGETEGLHFMGHKGFTEEFPEAAELIGQIKLDDAQYGALENMVVNEFGEGKEPEAIDAWLEEYGDQFDWVVTE